MKNDSSHQNSQPPKMKTKEEIADEMNIHVSTLNRHLRKGGMTVARGLISPEVQREI